MTRGIYVLHTPKEDNNDIYKVGMSKCIEERKGDFETVLPQDNVVMSRIYELHDGVDLHKYEGMLHDILEERGFKIPNKIEHFAATLDEIDECATEMFMQFPDILKKVHNEDRTPSASRKSKRAVDQDHSVQEVLRTFDQLIEAEASTSQAPPIKNKHEKYGHFKLRVDQEELIARLQQHFMEDNNPRGQIHLPPGYGKTEVGCCLFPVVNNIKRALILVPTIRLAEETMKRIKAFHATNLGVTHYNYFEVHSNSTSCDIDAIRNSEYVYVVAVYNSVIKLHDTTPFDIIIFDEAHRTSIKCQAQSQDNVNDEFEETLHTHYTFALTDDNIQSTYRLFMTATPRIMNNDENSMSNEDKYGHVIYSMSMRQAVKMQIINDYRIWMYVKETNQEAEGISSDAIPDRLQLLTRFVDECTCQKVLTVCKSIKSCNAVAKGMSDNKNIEVYKVHSGMSKREINSQIEAFVSTENRAILCAVNMFREGINCPAIDGIVFFDERKSVIDVIQIVGRALRRKPNTPISDIGILCTLDKTKRMDDQSDMRYLRMIMQNMFDHSEELSNNLRIIKQDNEELPDIDQMVKEVREQMKDDEDTQNHEQEITKKLEHLSEYGEKNFQNARAFARAQSAMYNWRLKDDWFDYISRVGLPADIPRRPDRVYKYFGWVSWDDFLGLAEDKPFDFYTLKYVLQKEIKNINPSSEEYAQIIAKYGSNKLVPPHEYGKLYSKGFYDVLSDVLDIPIPFMSLQELKAKKMLEYGRQRFMSTHYEELSQMAEYNGKLPYYPMAFYSITSFMQV
jgi:superfamily II DNA or RNA helicase